MMKLDAEKLMPPLLAALILVLTLNQTLAALKKSGTWGSKTRGSLVRPEDPYAMLDRELGRSQPTVPLDQLRDPFSYVAAPRAPAVRVTRATIIPKTVEPEVPVLTAIVWDNDPRATIHFDNRDFSVRENSLFADFRVMTITSTQVILARNGQSLVLTLRPKGE